MGAATAQAYECHLCGGAAAQSCGGCGALFYCSDDHRVAHWGEGGHGGAECTRMAADVAEGPSLRRALPFPWTAAQAAAEVATEEASTQRESDCVLLERLGVHGRGLWRRECACGAAGPFGACARCAFSALRCSHAPAHAGALPGAATRDALWALPRGHAPGDLAEKDADATPSEEEEAAPTQPRDWPSFYALRHAPAPP